MAENVPLLRKIMSLIPELLSPPQIMVHQASR